MTFRRAFFAAFSTALLLGLAWGCAAADDSGAVAPGVGGSGGGVEPDNDASLIMPGTGSQDSGSLALNPLCGKKAEDIHCVPDSAMSCSVFTPPVTPGEDAGPGGDAAANGQAGDRGDSGEGGSGGDSAGPSNSGGAGEGGASGARDGGASGAGGEAGASSAAGAPGVVPGTGPTYSCQVQRAESAPFAAFSGCALAGIGGENAPCLTAKDCQPGLGCVGDQTAGLCQKYCCQDANDCEHGTYCAPRPMRDATVNAARGTPLYIPVCVHAENCDLSAPYPCPSGSECACGSGTACVVVRSDGTTTCAVPGTGKVGEACPCAWGYVCSAASNQCLELCNTEDSSACGSGKCQSASELPNGWGVCVSGSASGG